MPIYEYKCEGCGEVFEVIQKFADEPLAVHEKCGGHVHRLMSAPSFQFKGSGWYVTDYAKGNVSGPPKHESGKSESAKGESGKAESTGDTATKTETKTEAKSESKSESKPASSEKAS
ncbi:MAG TPA: FmdB family zinc ribbon protein [Bryobacteraceae bacterium]|nr:FmdB family zinc ribbon protein [Bryobacteraceae bacterium]